MGENEGLPAAAGEITLKFDELTIPDYAGYRLCCPSCCFGCNGNYTTRETLLEDIHAILRRKICPRCFHLGMILYLEFRKGNPELAAKMRR